MADVCAVFTVYADGSICLDILQNRWSPTYDVSSILTSIQVTLDLFWQLSMLLQACFGEYTAQ